MAAVTTIARTIDLMFRVVILVAASLSGASVFLMSLLMAANVISRQVFNKPFLDTVQLGELSVVIMTFLGLAWVYRPELNEFCPRFGAVGVAYVMAMHPGKESLLGPRFQATLEAGRKVAAAEYLAGIEIFERLRRESEQLFER